MEKFIYSFNQAKINNGILVYDSFGSYACIYHVCQMTKNEVVIVNFKN